MLICDNLFSVVFCFSFGLCLSYMWEELSNGVVWSIVITSILGFLMIITVLLMFLQPRNKNYLTFQVILVLIFDNTNLY